MGFLQRIKKIIASRQVKKKARRDEASELKIILDHIPMAVYWKDAGLFYRGGNKQFGEMSGLSSRDLPGKTDIDLHTEETAARFRKEDMEFLCGEKKDMYFTDKLVPMKNDSSIWARTYKIPVFNDNANIKYIMGVIQDVTKVKQDEIALAVSESRLRTILNATNDRIVFVDFQGKILTVNGSFLNDFIPGEDEAAGKYLNKLIAPKFFQKIQKNIEMAVETGEPCYFELLPGESQTNKYFDISLYPVMTEDGIIGAAIFAKDITIRKQTEEMLVKRSEQLQAAMNEAESASRSKSDFLSRMSHEIRTPISAIIGMTKIAYGTNDMEKIKDCLQKIDNSSKHLLGIINDVLDMSKIEADKFNLSDAVFGFENMIMDVVNVVSVRANEQRQNLEIFLDDSLPEFFYADEIRLRQVITNLLSNAIKFTPEQGTIQLVAENLGITEGIAELKMTVSDTGIGISPKQLDRLFQPFEQADGGITRKYGGTGLGLVICKKIIEMMGGQIHAESQPQVGSRFIFNVKMKVYHTGQEEAVRKYPDMRVLIVENCVKTGEYLSDILKKYGVRTEVAVDGNDAVRKAEEAKNNGDIFNISFINCSIPGMDGIDTDGRIKTIMDEITVVLMVSVSEKEKIEKPALEAGVDKFIQKPFFPSYILSVLDEITGSSGGIKTIDDENRIPDLKGYRILLAEDIEINREIAAALLEPTQAEIEFAVNGKEAVNKYNENKDKYDLILMDIHMPEMDGYEATRLIRANRDERSRSIPIIAMTADAFKEDIDKCKAIGMNDHVAKPINEDELFTKIISQKNNYINNLI